MNLIIVESPTKARTLSRFLGEDYIVEATMGHIKDLPKSKLSIDIENNFKPDYVVVAKRRETIQKLKDSAKKASKIYLASDPDREGEAIAQHVKEILMSTTGSGGTTGITGRDKPNSRGTSDTRDSRDTLINRIVFHEITKEAVDAAIKNPRDIDKHLVNAQIARRVLDRLVGYKLSPLLWKKVRRGLSAGRVQSVTVRLIVEREKEIEKFKPEEYWEVYAEVAKVEKVDQVSTSEVKSSNTLEVFVVKLVKIGDKIAKVENKDRAQRVVSDLEKSDYKVLDVIKKEVSKNPFPPFTTSTMTQSAARLHFWSSKKTMSIAQRLYEEGLITYHRTDSTNIAFSAIGKVRNFIEKNYGNEYLPEKPKFYKTTSKVAQEAHEAIRPTDVSNSKLKIQNSKVENDMRKLYELIWKRFVTCQMAASIYDETTIDVEATPTSEVKSSNTSEVYILKASGQVMKFDGWRKVFGKKIEEETIQLPEVSKDEPLQLIKVDPQQKFTQPPARYTEASLIKTLEKLGIGRPSTYAPIISTIQIRQYVEKEEGKFTPTPIGVAVNDFLVKNFPIEVDYQFTAKMENNLDEIANGNEKWADTIAGFWKPFEKKLKDVEKNSKRVKIETEKLGKKCPECKKGELVIRTGRFGKFISCSRFPDCKHTEKYLEKINIKCPQCKEGDVIIKTTRKGRKFFGCSRYPDCKWASWRKPNNENDKPKV